MLTAKMLATRRETMERRHPTSATYSCIRFGALPLTSFELHNYLFFSNSVPQSTLQMLADADENEVIRMVGPHYYAPTHRSALSSLS